MKQHDQGEADCSQTPKRQSWTTPKLKVVHHYDAELSPPSATLSADFTFYS